MKRSLHIGSWNGAECTIPVLGNQTMRILSVVGTWTGATPNADSLKFVITYQGQDVVRVTLPDFILAAGDFALAIDQAEQSNDLGIAETRLPNITFDRTVVVNITPLDAAALAAAPVLLYELIEP